MPNRLSSYFRTTQQLEEELIRHCFPRFPRDHLFLDDEGASYLALWLKHPKIGKLKVRTVGSGLVDRAQPRRGGKANSHIASKVGLLTRNPAIVQISNLTGSSIIERLMILTRNSAIVQISNLTGSSIIERLMILTRNSAITQFSRPKLCDSAGLPDEFRLSRNLSRSSCAIAEVVGRASSKLTQFRRSALASSWSGPQILS
ncbi:MAG: hypothetical protein P9M08_11005 [Candidatus Erginobacter occultus]|nr:hypothetical protein [Candidatus Erginobacter occultus]